MNQDQQKALTLKHGRLLHEQGKTIISKLEELRSLLEESGSVTADPIEAITALLQQIVENQVLHDQRMRDLAEKLEALQMALHAERP